MGAFSLSPISEYDAVSLYVGQKVMSLLRRSQAFVLEDDFGAHYFFLAEYYYMCEGTTLVYPWIC